MKLIIFLLLISISSWAQVNIEKYRNLDVSGNLHENYNQTININTALTRSTSSLYSIGINYFKPFPVNSFSYGFLISKINYGKSNGSEFANDNFLHMRIMIKKEYMRLQPEIFSQYEKNDFSSTTLRYLVGFGARYKLSENTIFGTSLLNEWYTEEGQSKKEVLRLSQYIHFRLRINPENKIDATFYIQPNINNFSDIRYFSHISFTNHITKSISYNSNLISRFYNKSITYPDLELFFKSGLEFKLN
ncbi:MAG: DUF481 domain-containing protein [Candidatus Margulisiibacteriota bacterium]